MELALALLPLVAGCGKIIKSVHDVHGKFKTAPLTMVSIATECSTIHVILGELQHIRTQRQDGMDNERFERIMASLETLASSCKLTLDMIDENIEDLLGTDPEKLVGLKPSDMNVPFRSKVKILFREDDMKELLGQLRGYQNSLTALLTTLQSHSTKGIYDMLVEHGTALGTLIQRSRSSWLKRTSSTQSSIRDRDDASSMLSIDRLSMTVFNFDEAVCDTDVYQRSAGTLQNRDTLDTGAYESIAINSTDIEIHWDSLDTKDDEDFDGEKSLENGIPDSADEQSEIQQLGLAGLEDFLNAQSRCATTTIPFQDTVELKYCERDEADILPTEREDSTFLRFPMIPRRSPSRPQTPNPHVAVEPGSELELGRLSHVRSISESFLRKKPSATLLKKKASGSSLRKKLSDSVLKKNPSDSFLRKKFSDPFLRRKLEKEEEAGHDTEAIGSISPSLSYPFTELNSPGSRGHIFRSNTQKLVSAYKRDYQLVVCGPRSGKTSLVLQFVHGKFIEELYDPTIEDNYTKYCNIDDERLVLSVTDTTSMSEYEALQEQVFRPADGFLIVYNITSRWSFNKVKQYYDRILRSKDSLGFPIVLVGTKSDRKYDREVSTQEGMAVAAEHGLRFFEASTKENHNVEKVFFELIREVKRYSEAGYPYRYPPYVRSSLFGPPGGRVAKEQKCQVM